MSLQGSTKSIIGIATGTSANGTGSSYWPESARLGPMHAINPARQPIGRQWPALLLLILVSLSWWRERTSLR